MPTKNRYSAEFFAARPKAIDRAGNKCEDCAAEGGKPHPVSGKLNRLQVHHLDGNHKNNTLENLRVLCASCHTKRKEKANKLNGMDCPPGNRAKSGIFTAKEKTKNNAKKRHGLPSRKQGKVSTFDVNGLRVFLKRNKVVLKKLRLYGELSRLAGGQSMPEVEKEEIVKAALPTESGGQSMPNSENSDIIEIADYQRFHRPKEEQVGINAGYAKMEGAILWFKSLPLGQQQTIKTKIIEKHGSFAERQFVLEKYGRYLQTRLLQAKEEYESNEKAN